MSAHSQQYCIYFYLILGETFRSLAFQFRMGERTISGIVEETCLALYEAMKGNYLKVPVTYSSLQTLIIAYLIIFTIVDHRQKGLENISCTLISLNLTV